MKPKDYVVKVKNVSKHFILPHEKKTSVKSLFTSLFRHNGYSTKQKALKQIDFTVKRGEFFGIVGRNGSGKSTLLKIIAGIYQPTTGTVKVNGRLVTFIELGVGFNPELTGRENVYLNGSLLGFTRKEIDEIYDDIVEFAELEDFMDQNLKNYSSGMQVRLAFSVAIKAKGDILILDEVLAVGDEAFQRKCEEYFKEIKKDTTKTVILVTHNMGAVRKFCDRAMMIRNGKIAILGTPEDVANEYTQENFKSTRDIASDKDASDGLSDRVPYFKVLPVSKRILSNEDTLVFDIEYEVTDDTPVRVFFSIIEEMRAFTILANGTMPIKGRGKHRLTYKLPLKYFNDSDLYVNAVIDEVDSKKRIAFTNSSNSCRFAVRNKVSDNGLLRKDNDIHGNWIDCKEYCYNLKEIN
ncbi:ABC transporter ATP-binding protein [Candidatus Nomurabacteria bacterium]|nr:ABC transporter ATP-binding protein [Candidatus Nomurabacteria bacterium]